MKMACPPMWNASAIGGDGGIEEGARPFTFAVDDTMIRVRFAFRRSHPTAQAEIAFAEST
jgi:hypothetical protein